NIGRSPEQLGLGQAEEHKCKGHTREEHTKKGSPREKHTDKGNPREEPSEKGILESGETSGILKWSIERRGITEGHIKNSASQREGIPYRGTY
ncbi:hypothetical protein XELAEV_18044504mg, partial [Xenopus laevis]